MTLRETTFVALDTETTGLSKSSCIVEIGAVKFRGNTMLDTFSTLVRPPEPIPKRVTAVHGITNTMVRSAPRFRDVAPRLLRFIGDSIIVAHNAPFDMEVISRELERAGLPSIKNPVIDTCRLSKCLFPGLPSYKLSYLRKALGSPTKRDHRALSDAKNTAYIFIAMLVKTGLLLHGTLDDLKSLVPLRSAARIYPKRRRAHHQT